MYVLDYGNKYTLNSQILTLNQLMNFLNLNYFLLFFFNNLKKMVYVFINTYKYII